MLLRGRSGRLGIAAPIFGARGRLKRVLHLRVDLHGLQETFVGSAWGAAIGQEVEVPIAGLDEGQPHLLAALDARHLNAGLKAGAGRGWSGYRQHCILVSRNGETQRYSDAVPPLLWPIPNTIGNSFPAVTCTEVEH
jgi:hypothetical protein